MTGQITQNEATPTDRLAVIVLAAGMSRRMGRPKLLLPWGSATVLGQVMTTLARALIDAELQMEMVVVTGAGREAIEAEAARLAVGLPLRTVFNAQYQAGEMMSSLRAGLTGLNSRVAAALIALGDQPQLSLESARKIVSAWRISGSSLIIPSFAQRRGHPWIVGRELWDELLQANTAREFLRARHSGLLYVACDETVLKDVDTPEDYAHGLQSLG